MHYSASNRQICQTKHKQIVCIVHVNTEPSKVLKMDQKLDLHLLSIANLAPIAFLDPTDLSKTSLKKADHLIDGTKVYNDATVQHQLLEQTRLREILANKSKLVNDLKIKLNLQRNISDLELEQFQLKKDLDDDEVSRIKNEMWFFAANSSLIQEKFGFKLKIKYLEDDTCILMVFNIYIL